MCVCRPFGGHDPSRQPWLQFQSFRSPTLRFRLTPTNFPASVAARFALLAQRVVNPHLQEFLRIPLILGRFCLPQTRYYLQQRDN